MPQDAARDPTTPALATARPAQVESNLPGWSFGVDGYFGTVTFKPYRTVLGMPLDVEVRVALSNATFEIVGTDCRFPSEHRGFVYELPEQETQTFVAKDVERTRHSLGAKFAAAIGQGGATGQGSADHATEQEATGTEEFSTDSTAPRPTITTGGDEVCMLLTVSATRLHHYLEGSLPRKRVGTAVITGDNPSIRVTMTIAQDDIDVVSRVNGRYRRRNGSMWSRFLVKRAFCGRTILMADVPVPAEEGKADVR